MQKAITPDELASRRASGRYIKRTCSKCGGERPALYFHKGQNKCKFCRSKENKQYRITRKEEIKQYKKEYKQKFPERVKASQKKYRDKHEDDFKRYKKEFYLRHGFWADPNNTKERSRKYRLEHPEIVKAAYLRYKEQKKANGGSHTAKEWRKLVAYFEHKCVCCRQKPKKLEKDHVKPVSMGGSNSIENIQPLCRSCNCKKRDNYIDYRKGFIHEYPHNR
jgi:hypothetical protein